MFCYIAFWDDGKPDIHIESYPEGDKSKFLTDKEIEPYRENLLSIGVVLLISGNYVEIAKCVGSVEGKEVSFEVDSNFEFVRSL